MKFVLLLLCFGATAFADSLPGKWSHESYTLDFVTKDYFTYVPSTYKGKATPLVVMLHGCHQNATDFARNTGMNALAEKYGFLVLYPQQDSLANLENCWNFFFPINQIRSGEPAIIVGMVDAFKRSVAVDDTKIYAAGLSSGAAMAAVLGSCYSDIFSGLGIASGLEYEAAMDVPDAYSAMDNGSSMNPHQAAHDAIACTGRNHARMQKVFAIQGTADTVVSPINLSQVVTQFNTMNASLGGAAESNPLNTVQGQVPGGRSYSIQYFGVSASQPMLAEVKVNGMDHAWSGGPEKAKYFDTTGPNASEMLWLFLSAKGL